MKLFFKCEIIFASTNFCRQRSIRVQRMNGLTVERQIATQFFQSSKQLFDLAIDFTFFCGLISSFIFIFLFNIKADRRRE